MDKKNLVNITSAEKYASLATAAGMGSLLGSGCIIGLSATLPIWQQELDLTTGQVGVLSGALTFAIAFGSLSAGRLAQKVGLVTSFNRLNFFYAIGAGIFLLSNSFLPLLIGSVILGFASGADLPISLTVVSSDAPDEATSAKLVSSTQIFWQMGVFISYISSFLLSGIEGVLGARIVFGILFILSVFTWLWRSFSQKLAQLHAEKEKRLHQLDVVGVAPKDFSIKTALFGLEKKYLQFFLAILTFFVCWNLLANTWGQFQTIALINAGATQTQATGLGILLNIVSLIAVIAFVSLAGGKHRNKAFFIGGFIQFGAMIGLALIGGGAGFIALAVTIAFYSLGSPLAGEAIYKVWTQESFPAEIRTSLQGFINGFSRICCGLFAFITPALVTPERIQMTMFGFAGIILVATLAGGLMMRLQKNHPIEEKRNGDPITKKFVA